METFFIAIVALLIFILFLAPRLNNFIARQTFAGSIKKIAAKNDNVEFIPHSKKWLWGQTSGEHSDFKLIVGDTLYIVKICTVFKTYTYFMFESATFWKQYTVNRMAGFGGTDRKPKETCLDIQFDLAKEKKEAQAKLGEDSKIKNVETVLLFCPKAISYNVKVREDMITAEPNGHSVFGSLLFEDEIFIKEMKKLSKDSSVKSVDSRVAKTLEY